MKYLSFLALPLLVFSVACGGSSSSSDSSADASATSADAPAITRISDTFGVDGNLWKPAAEEGSSTAGLLVVLPSSKYTGRFDSCEIELIDGTIEQLDCNDRVEWSHTPFSCVANGNREHWRSQNTCNQAAQVRVICRNATEELTIEAPGAGITAVCSRFG